MVVAPIWSTCRNDAGHPQGGPPTVHLLRDGPLFTVRRDGFSANGDSACNTGTYETRFRFAMRLTARHPVAKTARRMKPQVKLPVCCLSCPSTSGGKNPPNPPAAPTRPVALPTVFGKH